MRTLRHDWPDIDVIADVGKVVNVPVGSTIVLAPRKEDAEWLNLHRGQFSDRRLKVVLWCDEETALALKFRAPDFSDWIGRRKECPRGPVPFAIRGIRAAFENGWPVAWTGTADRAAVEAVVRAACPGEEVVWLPEDAPFDELVSGMKGAGVVAADTRSERALRRVRWARAAAGRKTRVVLVTGELEAPGFWPVHDRTMPLFEARDRLAAAGARAPGRVAALLDLEPEAILIAEAALKGDPFHDAWSVLSPKTESQIADALAEPDAGAAMVRLALGSANELSWGDLLDRSSPPELRGLVGTRFSAGSFHEWAKQERRNAYDRRYGALAAHSHHQDWYVSWMSSGDTRAWAIEMAFFAAAVSPNMALEVACALASFGDGDAMAAWLQSAWLRHGKKAAVADAVRPVLAKISGAQEAGPLFGVLREIAETWNMAVAHADKRERWHHGGLQLLAWALGALGLFAAPMACLLGEKVVAHPWLRILLTGGAALGLISLFIEVTSRVDKLESGFTPRMVLPDTKRLESEGMGAQDRPLVRRARLLRTRGRPLGAVRAIEQRLTSTTAPRSKDLLSLAARVLADTGRAADATRALVHLTATALPASGNLRPEPGPDAGEDPFLQRLLEQPAGVLSDLPEAHLTLVDALLKQGRYPEALIVARGAVDRFSPGPKEKAVSELAARTADLERRIGTAAE